MFFKNLMLTQKGREMILASNGNIDETIIFTVAKFGRGRLSPSEINNASDIKSPWKTQNINTARIDRSKNEPKLILEVTFTNLDMVRTEVMSEIGFYARSKSNEETLIGYSITETPEGKEEEINPNHPVTLKISLQSLISNNTNITNIIDPDGFLTKEIIELLKEVIRNVGFRKFHGELTKGQKIIKINDVIGLSNRCTVTVNGITLYVNRDYILDLENSQIILDDIYDFENGSPYEIVDSLPAQYWTREELSYLG